MTKRAQKPKNKEFKNFNVLKSASNEREREREREKSPAQTLPHFLRVEFANVATLCFVRKHHFATLAKPNLPCH